MKNKLILLIGIALAVLAITFAGLYGWIAYTVKHNITVAMEKYPGQAEDALISCLRDESNSPRERTHVAVWTLGKIRSRAALPALYSYYRNDPEGKTCYGRHGTDLCQYELYKAIKAIEEGTVFSFQWLR
ncbi:MAG TPA: HEAT repeat domain-containing protein [Spirochaetota bacterium]|nr:HEAT repeat domain-containing protein [Spirochaetota bacterium]HPI89748.1 HEAT repeat domain-containing protein [Spirochaetota bacterium]HPR46619.1 HEAT repeat domain-containing protein [Spirochaetota bacterium]